AIVQMRLGQLTGLEREKIEEELAGLLVKIAELEGILADKNKILTIIKDEAREIVAKLKDGRKTEIQTVSGEVDIEDLIPVEDCVITLTHLGYIKRQPVDVYKSQRRGGRGISGMTTREEDFVETLFIGSTHDYVLFFSNRGRVYRLKCYEIPESSRTARGVNVVNLLPLEPEEKITSMIRVEEFRDDHYLVMVTKNGIIKRTELSAYHTTRKGGVIAISLDEGDDLAWVRLTDGNCEVFVATKNGMIIRFHEQDARPLSRTARGVKAISLEDGDEVVGMARIREGATLLTVTTKGQGRRTRLEDYRVQNRAGKGLTNYHVSEEKGTVAGIKVVDETDDIILITDDGIIIRFAVDQIPIQSRYAGGVRVMRTSENSQVVTLARAEHEEDEEESAESPQEAEGQETEELSKEISPENPSPAQE
ncbi:MAG TPA: DNA gyrase subunit A, partial [Firmicutes bacterium]|nr:DNA gyrase subunit A [Bacillota bacterium]